MATVKIQIALATNRLPDIFYHGTKSKFSKFSEYRPAFFTNNIHYAKQYGPVLIKARLDIRRIFDTRFDRRAVAIYNEYFLTSGLARKGAEKIRLGQPVHMNDADELWSYLAVPEYPKPHYDGIAVHESNISALSADFKDADISYVPLSIKQIHVVHG